MRRVQERVTLDFVTRDPTGKIVRRHHYRCHSFLTQYYQLQYCYQANRVGVNGPAQAINDTGGTSRNFQALATPAAYNIHGSQALATDSAYGIQVGTGNTANGAATAALATLIAHGVGAGRVLYGSMGITAPAGSAPLVYTFTRTFTNTSGGTVNITEAGLVFACLDTGATQRNLMILRDVFAQVPVLNGNNTTATYTLSYTIA